MSIVMDMQNFIKIYKKIQGIGPVSLFQNLNLGKTSTYPKYHLTISLATSCQYQCVCKISSQYFTVLEIGPFSLFQNLELGKASTDKTCQFAISCANSCQYQCLRKRLSKYSTQFSSRDRVIFTFSEFGTRQSLDR